jgi:hypothetical protein
VYSIVPEFVFLCPISNKTHGSLERAIYGRALPETQAPSLAAARKFHVTSVLPTAMTPPAFVHPRVPLIVQSRYGFSCHRLFYRSLISKHAALPWGGIWAGRGCSFAHPWNNLLLSAVDGRVELERRPGLKESGPITTSSSRRRWGGISSRPKCIRGDVAKYLRGLVGAIPVVACLYGTMGRLPLLWCWGRAQNLAASTTTNQRAVMKEI